MTLKWTLNLNFDLIMTLKLYFWTWVLSLWFFWMFFLGIFWGFPGNFSGYYTWVFYLFIYWVFFWVFSLLFFWVFTSVFFWVIFLAFSLAFFKVCPWVFFWIFTLGIFPFFSWHFLDTFPGYFISFSSRIVFNRGALNAKLVVEWLFSKMINASKKIKFSTIY